MSDVYFFDTYALIEIIRGNHEYKQYRDKKGITTIFNIAELNYILKKEHTKKIADNFTNKFKSITVGVLWNDVLEAMDLKVKRKNLSIPDAIGYVVANRYNVRFLTGDEDFKEFEKVEFVKRF